MCVSAMAPQLSSTEFYFRVDFVSSNMLAGKRDLGDNFIAKLFCMPAGHVLK
jgi:hypothetical protein